MASSGTKPILQNKSAAKFAILMLALASPMLAQYTINHQQPITDNPYPNSFLAKPLPNTGPNCTPINGGCGPLDHLAPNSDNMAVTTLFDTGDLRAPRGGWTLTHNLTGTVAAYGLTDDQGQAFYYGQATDPVYKILSCGPHPPAPHDPNGTLWHMPSRAEFPNNLTDQGFLVWDQTDDMILALYYNKKSIDDVTFNACPGNDLQGVYHRGTVSDACPAVLGGTTSLYYCSMSKYHDRSPSAGYAESPNAWATNNLWDWTGSVRGEEIMRGHFYHPLYLDAACTNGTPVFPGVNPNGSPGSPAALCSGMGVPTINRPPNGSLFFLDYTDAQLADIKSKMTLAQQKWQYPFLEAMTHYGGYLGDTGGGLPLQTARVEGPSAYHMARIDFPLVSFLEPLVDGTCLKKARSWRGSVYKYNIWCNVAVETGPNCQAAACTIEKHLHIANPCVPKGLAGATGGCLVTPATRSHDSKQHNQEHQKEP